VRIWMSQQKTLSNNSKKSKAEKGEMGINGRLIGLTLFHQSKVF